MISIIFGELLAIVFVAGTSHLAVITGVSYLLFPEMGALAYDTCKRPFGVWACAPVSLFVAPTVAAAIGTAISWGLPSSLAATALCITLAVGLLRLARSPIAPAISAAYLPLALNVRTWHYPVAIAVVTGALACIVLARRHFLKIDIVQPRASRESDVDDILESVPQRFGWMLFLATFLLLAYGLSRVSRFPLVLFPPLIVIAYEMFAHSDVCPWARRPLTLPVACTLGAAIGMLSIGWFGVGPLSVVIALTAGIAILRVLKLHMPPVLGISLLPQVLPHADWTFIVAVAIGASGLTGFFMLIRPLLRSAFFVHRRGEMQ